MGVRERLWGEKEMCVGEIESVGVRKRLWVWGERKTVGARERLRGK